MSQPSAVYVYGVVRAEAADGLDLLGVGDPPGRIEALRHQRLAALVSRVDTSVREATREDLMAHARTLEAAGERMAVLPMRFGMTLPTAEAVIDELLAPHHDRWDALLDEFADVVEVRVKAFQDQEALLRQLVADDPQIRSLRGRQEMSDRVRLGELVASALERRRQADAAWLLERLRPLSKASRDLDPALGGMVLDTAFLVSRDDVRAFDREVAAASEEAADRLRLRCLGPQPPYTFVAEAVEA